MLKRMADADIHMYEYPGLYQSITQNSEKQMSTGERQNSKSTGENICLNISEVDQTDTSQQNKQNIPPKCLIAVAVFVSVMVLLMTTTAFALAVISYSKSMDEAVSSTSKVNFISSKLNQIEETISRIDSISSQLNQLSNEKKELEEIFTRNISSLSIQHQQFISSTHNNISQLRNYVSSLQEQIYCGAGQWYRVAFLNMSDPSHQCPPPWQFTNSSGVRRCQSPSSSGVSCSSISYSTGRGYRRVCGRVIGYQYGSPDAFNHVIQVDNPYMDGVSITYGNPRRHIWSYVCGVTESSSDYSASNCPCSTASGRSPPSFIGNNYYCESGNPTDTINPIVYTRDKLWDGQQCEGTCCSGIKYPPWFSVHVAKHTTDSIEVRICGDDGTDNENTPIELLEIYVQ